MHIVCAGVRFPSIKLAQDNQYCENKEKEIRPTSKESPGIISDGFANLNKKHITLGAYTENHSYNIDLYTCYKPRSSKRIKINKVIGMRCHSTLSS